MKHQYFHVNSYMSVLLLGLVTISSLLPFSAQVRGQEADIPSRPLAEVYEIIEDFIREDYLSSWFASPRLIRRHFSDPLDYYWGKKNVPLKSVVRDKMAYVARWPQRYFRLIGESLEVMRTEVDDNLYAVKFRYEFETRRKGDERAGLGETGLLIQLRDTRVIIRGEGGKVLKRY